MYTRQLKLIGILLFTNLILWKQEWPKISWEFRSLLILRFFITIRIEIWRYMKKTYFYPRWFVILDLFVPTPNSTWWYLEQPMRPQRLNSNKTMNIIKINLKKSKLNQHNAREGKFKISNSKNHCTEDVKFRDK